VIFNRFVSGASALLALTLLFALDAAAQTNAPPDDAAVAKRLARLGKRSIRAHDPSTIVRDQEEYWLFVTGRGVPSFHSKDLQTWISGPPVFTNQPPWVAGVIPTNRPGLNFWAPDVIALGGRYLLYYSASTFGKNVSGIGLATNLTLDPSAPGYRWVDCGAVVRSTAADNYNTIDPSVSQDAEGGLWLAFGSFWSGIKLIQLDPATGLRLTPDSPVYSLAHYSSIEAACIYHHEGYYYLFVNWGKCCRGINSTYNIRMGRARRITGPYLDQAGVDLMAGGGTLFLETDGPFIGPGHAGILREGGRYWLSLHFYDPTRGGAGTLAIRPLQWGPDGWPKAGETARH